MTSQRITALARAQDRKRQYLDNAIVRLEVEGEKMGRIITAMQDDMAYINEVVPNMKKFYRE